ncbi:hypothetical protein D3C71_1733410 [compost metagenome]
MQHQLDGVFQRHHETGHGRVGDGDGLTRQHLFHEQRNDRTAGGHDVAVTRAANDRVRALQIPAGGDHHLFHHGLADAHGVDGIDRLVGAEADDAFYACGDCSFQDILGAEDIGADCLHWVEFARRYLLEGGRVEDVIYTAHCCTHAT